MEQRKLVKSGNTSYIMALPIAWIRRNNLAEGRFIQVAETEQGDLMLSAEKPKAVPKEEIVTIKVDGKEEEIIHLEFLLAYVRDAASIIFEGKEIIPKSNKILEDVKSLIGLDVIEQSTRSIIVKNFFSLDRETSPSMLLKKMDIVNRASFELLQTFFQRSFVQEDFSELQKLQEQNARLYLLIRKAILKLLENPGLMRSIQTDHLQTLKDKTFAHSYIDISLSLLSLGRVFLFLDRTGKEIKLLHRYVVQAYEKYQSLLNALYNKSPEYIYSFLKNYQKETGELEKFLKMVEDQLLIQALLALLHIHHDLEVISQEALT